MPLKEYDPCLIGLRLVSAPVKKRFSLDFRSWTKASKRSHIWRLAARQCPAEGRNQTEYSLNLPRNYLTPLDIESHLHILEDVEAQQVYPYVVSEGKKAPTLNMYSYHAARKLHSCTKYWHETDIAGKKNASAVVIK